MRILAVAASFTFAVCAQGPETANPLIVHEWGTFTSVQGSDGVVLEGVHREEELVPKFVHSLSEGREAHVALGPKGLSLPPRHVTQKMETPILYFHSAVPRELKVRVEFVRGLVTQWYPVVSGQGHDAQNRLFEGCIDFDQIGRSFVEWDVEVIPGAAARELEPPAVAAGDVWQLAREVDAAMVRTRAKSGEETRQEAEHYLFYRGLGTFALPVAVTAERGGSGVIRTGGLRLPFALAMQVDGDGGRVQALATAGTELRFDLARQPRLAGAAFTQRLHELVQSALVAQGLRLDEARAMVRTWTRSWFVTPGARILWIVPRERVDEILPLTITPKPDGLVRVLVGRLEYLTPEVEDAVETALQADGGEARLRAQERLLEPMLRRALARNQTPEVQRRARDLLTRLP